VRSGGVTRNYSLRDVPRGVAIGFGAVWVVGRGANGYELLRIDRSTGRVTRSRRFRSDIDSIGVGNGAVYVVGASDRTLYRIDPRSPKLQLVRKAHLGGRASRPLVTADFIGFATTELGGTSLFLDPVFLGVLEKHTDCCLPQWGEQRWANGWMWWYDRPTGSVYRQHGSSATPHTIRVTKALPQSAGPCLTSIDLGEGAVWVTATAPHGLSCTP
jgi:hypothetical protein